MSEFTEGAEGLDKFLAQFAALPKLSEMLRKAGSLEQAAKEAERRVADVKAETDRLLAERSRSVGVVETTLATVQNKLTEAQEAVEASRATARKIQEGAQANAQAVKESAQNEADDIIKRAKSMGHKIVDDAKKEAEPYETKVAAGKIALEEVNRQIADAEAKLKSVQDERAALLARLTG
jgi:cell division septum initiation protein DivIVA